MSSGIFHRQMSTEGDTLIAVHGLLGSLENLGVITRQLMREYAVYAVDLPSHGRSAHTDNLTLPLLAQAVVEWMSENNIEKAHFLGHSLGGKVAMEIALRYPEKVQCLVVADIAPVAYSHRHDDVFAALNAVDFSTIKARADADKQMRPYIDDVSTRSFLLKNLDKTESGWIWRMNLAGLIASYSELICANTTDFPPFEGEVLFIKGEHSSYILPEHRDVILRLFPCASVKVINNTQHWLHAEKPDVFSGIVKRFLAA